MGRLIGFLACLAAAVGLFFLATITPSPLPATARADTFSAGRTMADIAALAPVPHPVGSPANDRGRDYLIARMTALGLSPRVQHDESHRSETFGGEFYIGGADVENVIGLVHGRDSNLPALLLMAHRDSVPGSPGAADDIAGVGSVLEMVRAIEMAGRPARDIIVAITDGEESGLLGANAFFADDPTAKRVGFVINLEARGGGGRAAMFETGGANGGAIDLFARSAKMPNSTSLSVFIYKLLPNDTDFSIPRAKGLPGLNYAFIGRQFDYHSPSSTVAALDQGSVQHMGDEVLGTARALAFSTTLPPREPDKVYADVLGWFVVAYPAWAGWIALALGVVAAGVGAWRAGRAGQLRIIDIVKGVSATLLLLGGSAVVLAIARQLTGAGFGFLEQRPLLARFGLFEVAMAAGAVASMMCTAALHAGRRTRLAGVWSGLLLSAALAGIALQLSAPTIAFLVTWPLAAAGLVSALTAGGASRERWAWVVSAVIIVGVTAWLGVFFHNLLQAIDVPEAPALIVWLAALGLWPLMWPANEERRFVPGLPFLAVAMAVPLYLHFTRPWTPRTPQAAEPIYVVNPQDGRAWLADQVDPGEWTRSWLAGSAGRPGNIRLPGLARPMSAVTATNVPVSAPTISLTRGPDGLVTLRAIPATGSTQLRLDMACDTLLIDSEVNGRTTALAPPGQVTHVRWQAAPEGFKISFRPVGPGRLTLRWTQYQDRWPHGARPLPPMPADVMPWDLAGSTVVVGARTFNL